MIYKNSINRNQFCIEPCSDCGQQQRAAIILSKIKMTVRMMCSDDKHDSDLVVVLPIFSSSMTVH